MNNSYQTILRMALIAGLTVNSSLLCALTGDQSVSVIDIFNYTQIIDPVAPINLQGYTLTINSSYGLNQEPAAIFHSALQGVGLASAPSAMISQGNLTAIWNVVVDGNALDLTYSPSTFASLATAPYLSSLSAAIDCLATNLSYNTLITNLRTSTSVANYQNKLIALQPLPSMNNDISAVQDLAIGKVEQRLVELDLNQSLSYTAGTTFGNHAWIKPFVLIGQQNAVVDRNIQRYKTLVIGSTLGVDEVNLTNTKASGVSLSFSKIKLYQYFFGYKSNAYNLNTLFYGKYVNRHSIFMQWIGGLGVSYASQIRPVAISNIHEIARSNNKWYVGSAQLTVGHFSENDSILFKPGIGVLYTFNHNEGYQENGAPLTGLFVHSRDRHNAYAFAILDLSNSVNNPETAFTLNGYAKIQYLLSSPKQSYFANFINVDGTAFKSYSTMYRTQYRFGGNVKYTKYELYDATLGADYNIQNSFTSNSLSVYLRFGVHF